MGSSVMVPDTLRARECGGYVVVPRLNAVRAVSRLPVRAAAVRAIRRVLKKALRELDAEMVEIAMEMRFERGWKWEAIARHAGTSAPNIQRLVSARRRELGLNVLLDLSDLPTERLTDAA